MKKMNWKMNNISRKSAFISGYTRSGLIRKSGNALIMIVLMFAMLLVLGTGAVTLASSTSRRAINETKKEQAYIAARSVSVAIKDQIVNITDAEDRTKFVEKLKAAPKDPLSGNTNLTIDVSNNDVNYELLPVEAVGTNLEKYTVRATYAGVSEDYSFVLLNTPVSTPTPSDTAAFMTGNKLSLLTNVQMVAPSDDSALGIPSMAIANKTGGGHDVNLQSGLVGTTYIHSTANILNNFSITDGDLVVGSDFIMGQNVSVDGNVFVRGNVNISNGVINGNIYALGNVNIQNATINGDIFSNSRIVVESGNIAGSIYSSYYANEHILKSMLATDKKFYAPANSVNFQGSANYSMIGLLAGDALATFSQAIDTTLSEQLTQLDKVSDDIVTDDTFIPEWAKNTPVVPTNNVVLLDKSSDTKRYINQSGVFNKKNDKLILKDFDSNNVIDNDTFAKFVENGSYSELIIDATDGDVVIVLNYSVVFKKPIRTIGKVYFILGDNVNVEFQGPVIPMDEFKDDPIQTFLIGNKNNDVVLKSSFYGFISLGRPGGNGSGEIRVLQTNYGDYHKFKGLMIAPDLYIQPSNLSTFEVANPYASSDGSGGTGGSTSGYTYAGIIK